MMNRQNVLFLMALFFISGLMFGTKVTQLPEVMTPHVMAMDDDQFYVSQGTSLDIFSRKDYKHIKKVGKKGQGPKEFLGVVQIIVRPDDLVLNSFGKVSYYTKDGVMKEELMLQGKCWNMKPLGNKYVGFTKAVEDRTVYNDVCFITKELKKGDILYRRPRQVQQSGNIELITRGFAVFYVHNDIIYLNTAEDEIWGFDKSGKKVLQFKPKLDIIPVTQADRDWYVNFYKTNYKYKHQYPLLKNRITFPKNFEGIQTYTVSGNKIYIITYKKKDDMNECIIYDTKGKYLKTAWVPVLLLDPIHSKPYYIYKDTFYYLQENEDEEMWELHSKAL